MSPFIRYRCHVCVFQRAEKERDALMRTNARLLKQGTDKDDMNAKSLSTILHLKQQNEELTKKNSVLDQKAKAAQQLSLAARLAANAKNRVGEEVFKEKEVCLKWCCLGSSAAFGRCRTHPFPCNLAVFSFSKSQLKNCKRTVKSCVRRGRASRQCWHNQKPR